MFESTQVYKTILISFILYFTHSFAFLNVVYFIQELDNKDWNTKKSFFHCLSHNHTKFPLPQQN